MLASDITFGARNRQGRRTHGRSSTRTYKIWAGMKARCTNPNEPRYPDYGGRGIKVCARWMRFENFLRDMGPAPDGMTLERRKNEKGYSRQDCRWATDAEQNRNRGDTVLITHAGVTQCATDWAEQTGIGRKTIVRRLDAGWPIQDALTVKPVSLTDEERKLRFAVRQRLTRAVKSGKVTRARECQKCGRAAETQAHHHRGYSKESALDVQWLCPGCHRSRAGPSDE